VSRINRVGISSEIQPAIQADLRTRLGKVYGDIGQHAQAEAVFRHIRRGSTFPFLA
jgi:hypothetical protein